MKKHLLFMSTLAVLAASMIAGCRKSQPSSGAETAAPPGRSTAMTACSSKDPYFVTMESAKIFAEGMTTDMFLQHRSDGSIRNIINAFSLDDKGGIPALYVFNFEGGGYIVLSADFRFQPVCVFGETGMMQEYCEVPATLGLWYMNTVQMVEALREGIYDNGTVGLAQWNNYADQMGIGKEFVNRNVLYPDDPGGGDYSGGGAGCGTTTITVRNPLLRTTWGQGRGYNNKCPDLGCTTADGPNAPTGCVATAMAQVINYWRPTNTFYRNYNYSAMPSSAGTWNMNTAGAEQIQFLMQDCGNSMSMNWGCNSSGADGSFLGYIFNNSRIPDRLHNLWGISSGGATSNYSNVVNDRWIIVNDLNANRPVILEGGSDFHRFLGFEWSTGGHAWVCDGYKREKNNCWDEVSFHMNWGWNGYYNDWFFQSNWQWDPGPHWYPYLNKVIHNIHN